MPRSTPRPVCSLLALLLALALALVPAMAAAEAGTADDAPATRGGQEERPGTTPGTAAESDRPEPADGVVTRTLGGSTETDPPRGRRLDRETLVRNARETVADTLRADPAIHVQQTNRGAGAPMLRGQVGPGVLIVHDGVRINDATYRTGPNQYLNLFDALSLDRIEVRHGPAGAAWGSDAIGGVVVLMPPPLRYRRGFGFRLQHRYETADTSLVGSPELQWSNDRVSVLAGTSIHRHGTLRAGGGDTLPASDYAKYTARGGLGLALGRRSDLELRYAGGFIRDAGRTDRLDEANVRFLDNDQHLAWTRFTHHGSGISERIALLGSVKRTRELTRRHNCLRGDVYGLRPGLLTTIDPIACVGGAPDDLASLHVSSDRAWVPGASVTVESRAAEVGLRLHWGSDLQWTLVRGEARREVADGDRWRPGEEGAGTFPDGAHMGLMGVYATAVRPIDLSDAHTLEPQAGLRVDHARTVADDVPGIGAVRHAFSAVTASVGVAHHVGDHATAHIGWDQGFRAPNLQETTQLGNTGNFFELPNDRLQPERADSLEAGLRLRGADIGRLELRAWTLRVRDLIDRAPALLDGAPAVDGVEVVRRVNAGKAVFHGAEVMGRTVRWHGLSAEAGAGVSTGNVRDRDGAQQPARRHPPLRWSAGLDWSAVQWSSTFGVFAEGAGSQTRLNSGDEADPRICTIPAYPGVLYRDLGLACPGTPGWTTVGVRVQQEFGERTTLRLRLSNLLDRRYRTHGSGLDAPGFSAMLGLESRWGAARTAASSP